MGVPKKALEQAAEADRAMEQAQSLINPSQPAAAVFSPDAEGKPAKPAAPRAERTAESHLTVADVQAELERERQLRKTLEGRLNSQLKPANEEVRKLRAELNAQTERIHAMEQSLKKPGAERYISDEERTQLGDVMDLNSRMIKGILEEELEKNGVAAVVERIMSESNRAKTSSESQAGGPSADFWVLVDQYCPGARELNRNADERWVEFLDLFNTRTGQRNRVAAEQAISNDDPAALADMFADFMRDNGIAPEQVSANSNAGRGPAPKPERGGARVIQSQRTGADAIEPWTNAEVNAFYTDVSKGKFKGRNAERDKLEAEIMAAASAGKIT